MDPSPYVVTEVLRPSDVVRKTGVSLILYGGSLLVLFVVGFVWSEGALLGFETNGGWIPTNPLIFIVVGGMVYGLVRRVRPETLLAVRSEGVTIRSVSVPWSFIERMVIIHPEPSAYEPDEPEVGLRLVSDAPLPDGLSSLVIDPSTPADIPSGLRTALDGQPLDIAHLTETVDSYAPSRVLVTELHGDTERTVESSPQQTV